MRERSFLLPLYRLGSSGILPVMPALLRWRRHRGQADARRSLEWMGVAGLPRPAGRLVWIHAASIADGRSLLPLAERLGARGFHVLMSTRKTGSALERQLPPGALHQYMPVDVPRYIRRFLDHWRPDIVLLGGTEFWPNLLLETSDRRLPLIFVNASVPDRLFRQRRWARAFVASLLSRVDLCLARSDGDAERFFALGATSVQTVGDLVFDLPSPTVDPKAVSAFTARVGARPIWVAILGDPDDDDLVLAAHRLLLPRHPDLVTVVVPRDAQHAAAIVEAAMDQHLAIALRSRDKPAIRGPMALPALYVVDVAGEIGLFYRAGDIAFLGRSAKGGARSPVEAAKLGCAVLHGTEVEPHAMIYEALDNAQAAASIGDAAMLARVLSILFDDGTKLRQMQRNAIQTIDKLGGGTDRVMRAIEPHLVQMLVNH